MHKKASLFSLLLMLSNCAVAQLYFKNESPFTVWVAIGYYVPSSGEWYAQGWFKLEDNAEHKVFDYNLSYNRYYYYYAYDNDGNIWGDDDNCTDCGSFLIDPSKKFTKSKKGGSQGYEWKNFRRIDANGASTYTSKLTAKNWCSGNCDNGYGTYKWITDSKKYTGNWQNGKRAGKGTCTYGKYNKTNPGAKFIGEWADNTWKEGTMTYANGTKYVGSFKDSKYNGRGTFYNSDGSVSKSGVWASGEFVTPESHKIDNTPNKPNIWAVVVGISDYPGVDSDLKYCNEDARNIYNFLRSSSGGQVPDNQIKLLIDGNATLDNIVNSAEMLYAKATENDLLIFYFSGHGAQGNFFVNGGSSGSFLQHNTIRNILDKSRSKKKLCIADACHSGSWEKARKELVKSGKSLSDDELVRTFYANLSSAGNGLALFMSCQVDETSIDDGELRGGLFTYYYIEGLKGAADTDHDRIITLEELYLYVREKVSQRSMTRWKQPQTPQLKGVFDHDLPVGIRR
jgi:uncharacterized membrane protein